MVEELLGIPVIDDEGGAALGTIDAVLLDGRSRRVAGFVLRQGAHEALAIRFGAARILRGQTTAVRVASARDAVPLSAEPRLRDACEHHAPSPGTPVLTDRGDLVGRLADYVVDVADGSMVALDVLVRHGSEERQERIPVDAVHRLGSELSIVAEEKLTPGKIGPRATPNRKSR